MFDKLTFGTENKNNVTVQNRLLEYKEHTQLDITHLSVMKRNIKTRIRSMTID